MNIVIERIPSERKATLLTLINKSEKGSETIVSKTELDKVLSFFKDKELVLKMHDGQLIIQHMIAFENVKIKDCRNRVTTTITQKFNVGKSYVATTKKSVIETCRKFYQKIKLLLEERKVVFDISKEVNLQKEINTKVENDENNDKKEVPIQEENLRVSVISRTLNFDNNKGQAINESESLLLTTSVAAKEGLKTKYKKYIPQIQGNVEVQIQGVDTKKRVKTKNNGYIIPSILSAIIIIGIGIITYNIVYNFIK